VVKVQEFTHNVEKKKRIVNKDKSRPKNSNPKYFTVSRNDVVEVGEMVTIDPNGKSIVPLGVNSKRTKPRFLAT